MNTSVLPESATTDSIVRQFQDAFNRQDLDATMALMSDDCVFENTNPPPDGERHEGQENVRRAFADFFRSSPGADFTTEEMFSCGNRCTVRWIYHWGGGTEQAGHVRGVDLFVVHNGRITEKLSYVKG